MSINNANDHYKLKQILGTLDHVHGVRINFDNHSVDEIQRMYERAVATKNKIQNESAFNSYMQNPKYARSMLLVEASKIFLTEIAPKRRPKVKKPKSLNESMQLSTTIDKAIVLGKLKGSSARSIQLLDVQQKNLTTGKITESRQVVMSGPGYNKVIAEDIDRNMSFKQIQSFIKNKSEVFKGTVDWVQSINGKQIVYESEFSQNYLEDAFNSNNMLEDDNIEEDELHQPPAPGSEQMPPPGTSTAAGAPPPATTPPTPTPPGGTDSNAQAPAPAGPTAPTGGPAVDDSNPKPMLGEDNNIVDDEGNDLEIWLGDNEEPTNLELNIIGREIVKMADRMEQEAYNTIVTTDSMSKINELLKLAKAYRRVGREMSHLGLPSSVIPAQTLKELTDFWKYFRRYFKDEDSYLAHREENMRVVNHALELWRTVKDGMKRLHARLEQEKLQQLQQQENNMTKVEENNARRKASRLKEASLNVRGRNQSPRPADEIANAQTLLAAQDISDRLQKIAEQLAKMSVEDLMPLVDVMKRQFSLEVANGFNEVVKKKLEELLNATIDAKDETDNAILSLQNGETPTGSTDLGSASAPEFGLDDTGQGSGSELPPDEFGGSSAASGPDGSPLGREKKPTSDEQGSENGDNTQSTGSEQNGSDQTGSEPPPAENSDQQELKESIDRSFIRSIGAIKVNYRNVIGESLNKSFRNLNEFRNWQKSSSKFDIVSIRAAVGNKILNLSPKSSTYAINGQILDTKVFESLSTARKWMDLNRNFNLLAVDHDATIHLSLKPLNESTGIATRSSALQSVATMQAKKEHNLSSTAALTRSATIRAKSLYETMYSKSSKKLLALNETAIKQAMITRKLLVKKLAEQRSKFKASLSESNKFDVIGLGQDIEADFISQKINRVDNILAEAKSSLMLALKGTLKLVLENEAIDRDIQLVKESKAAPYGVIWTDSKSQRIGKFFETSKNRDYWVSLNESRLKNLAFIEPSSFDRTIKQLNYQKK